MKALQQIFTFLIFILLTGCVLQFIPETDEDEELLVVEGLITDQPISNKIKLFKSMLLDGKRNLSKPVTGSVVTITDDNGGVFNLEEINPGIYVTDSTQFQGTVGRKYTLYITTNASNNNLSYRSLPVEMKPVPLIDSLFYEKKLINESEKPGKTSEGCQIYLNTHDPLNNCRFYRWEYSETWEFRLPFFSLVNKTCWISNNSDVINIRNTSLLQEDRINRQELLFISGITDRLRVKYSVLVNQYSLNEDEYIYWEKLQNVSEQVGGLYDITPASIPSNIFCIEQQGETVLGYFSVSAVSSKRLFIKDTFQGVANLYSDCISDTIFGYSSIPNLDTWVWIVESNMFAIPPYRVLTDHRGCADCTVRGTTTKPSFWEDDDK